MSLQTLDPAAALERLGDDLELYQEILQVFIEESGGMSENLRSSYAAGERPVLERHAHSLKGASANIGAEQLRNLAFKLEQESKTSRLDTLQPLVDDVEKELRRVIEAIRSYQADAPGVDH